MKRTARKSGRTLALVLCCTAVVAAVAAVRQRPAEPGASAPSSARIAIFAVDAADWLAIDRLIARGQLPAFARLKQVASTGVLQAEPPLLSPIIWTTMATGREPADHGVLDFMVDLPGGGQAPVNARARQAKAIWEIWSQAGWPVLVTGWWATWPADRVHGVLVSDRVGGAGAVRESRFDGRGPPPPALVFPPERLADVRPLIVSPESLDYAALARVLPVSKAEFAQAIDAERQSDARLYQHPIAHFRSALAAARSYRAISTRLAERQRPVFWATYYELVDTACHLFIKDAERGEAAIAAAYGEIDGALADTARVLPPETWLVVISDHGFYPAGAAIRDDPSDLESGASAWHRPYGIVAVTTAGALRGGGGRVPPVRPLGRISPLDLVPSLLARAGLPVAADMPGRVVGALAGTSRAPAKKVATYGGHDLLDASITDAGPAARAEMERLRALGYIGSGASSSLGRVNLGEYLYRKRDLQGARRELEAVLRGGEMNERAALWLARTYADLERPDAAVRLYDQLIRSRGGSRAQQLDPIVFLAATDLDLEQRRVREAADRLAKAPASARETPEVRTAQGAVAEARGLEADAERHYRAALGAAPSDVESLQRLVALLLGARRIKDAESVAARGAREYPSSPIHLSLAGEVAVAEKRYRDAERRFAAALDLAPDSVSVRVALARARLLDGRPDAALDALSGTVDSPEADLVRGAALSKKSDWPGAVTAYERAVRARAPDPALLNALGHALLRAGRSSEAADRLERSLALAPNQPDIRRLLAEARRTPGTAQVEKR